MIHFSLLSNNIINQRKWSYTCLDNVSVAIRTLRRNSLPLSFFLSTFITNLSLLSMVILIFYATERLNGWQIQMATITMEELVQFKEKMMKKSWIFFFPERIYYLSNTFWSSSFYPSRLPTIIAKRKKEKRIKTWTGTLL